jgi:L-lactate permease
VLGLLAVAVVPATVVYAEQTSAIRLIWSGAAVPIAFVLGLAAVVAARAGRRSAGLTLRGRTGAGAARVGRLLGILGLLIAGSGTIALVVYALLTYRGRT